MIIDDLRLVINFVVYFVERLPSDLVDGKLFTNEYPFSSPPYCAINLITICLLQRHIFLREISS